jgi:hypothetical protein
VGQEDNPAVLDLVQHEALQTHDNLHVLAHRPHLFPDILMGDSMIQEWR